MLKVNGVWLPPASSFDVNVDDLDEEAFRSADGALHRTRIGKAITVNCTWEIIPNTNEFYKLYNLLDNMSALGNRLQFPHPNGKNDFIISCYRAAKMKVNMRSYYDYGNHRISEWKGLTATFIEDSVTAY